MTVRADAAEQRLVNVAELAKALNQFATERDWAQFHSPKNLVMALTGEVGERDELADVLLYLVRLADMLGVDLDDAARQKLATNAAKYPADKVRGSSKKYNEI
jgi:dCTP diphosphatase